MFCIVQRIPLSLIPRLGTTLYIKLIVISDSLLLRGLDKNNHQKSVKILDDSELFTNIQY